MDDKYKLCYVSGNWAFFTTKELSEQWGDDWNDVPYEHNAGYPYEWSERDSEPKWDVNRVAFDGNLSTPDHTYVNSPYSVEGINRGFVPWLTDEPWGENGQVKIMAGTTFPDFLRLVQAAGGHVYVGTAIDTE